MASLNKLKNKNWWARTSHIIKWLAIGLKIVVHFLTRTWIFLLPTTFILVLGPTEPPIQDFQGLYPWSKNWWIVILITHLHLVSLTELWNLVENEPGISNEIWGSYSCEDVNDGLLECVAVWTYRWSRMAQYVHHKPEDQHWQEFRS